MLIKSKQQVFIEAIKEARVSLTGIHVSCLSAINNKHGSISASSALQNKIIKIIWAWRNMYNVIITTSKTYIKCKLNSDAYFNLYFSALFWKKKFVTFHNKIIILWIWKIWVPNCNIDITFSLLPFLIEIKEEKLSVHPGICQCRIRMQGGVVSLYSILS